jgi:TATA-box binding protein (TBP) (component of TFIID and TFIIIB)
MADTDIEEAFMSFVTDPDISEITNTLLFPKGDVIEKFKKRKREEEIKEQINSEIQPTRKRYNKSKLTKKKLQKMKELDQPDYGMIPLSKKKKRENEQSYAKVIRDDIKSLVSIQTTSQKNKKKMKHSSMSNPSDSKTLTMRNVVATVNILPGLHMEFLKWILYVRYDKHIFSGGQFTLFNPRVTISLYSTGKAGITGANHPIEALLSIHILTYKLSKIFKRRIDVKDFKIVNIVGSGNLDTKIDLKHLLRELTLKYQDAVEYPDFPGLCWHLYSKVDDTKPKQKGKKSLEKCATVIPFITGFCTVIGIKRLSQFHKAQTVLFPTLRELILHIESKSNPSPYPSILPPPSHSPPPTIPPCLSPIS